MWKDAWWLTKKELNMQFAGILFTLIFTIFMAFLATSYFHSLTQRVFLNQDSDFNFFILDLIFLGVTPSFAAVFMSKYYLQFQTIKDDPFGKRLAMYRSLPISINTLALSRILFMLVIFMVNSLFFYLVLYVALPSDFYLDQQQILLFFLFWFGYSLSFGGLNTYVESGTNGKILMIFPLIFLVLLVVASFLVQNIWSIGMVEASIILIQNYPVTPGIISLLCGILSCLMIWKLLKKRLHKRDYV